MSHQGESRCPEAQSGGAGARFAHLCLWHGKPGWKRQPNSPGVAGRSRARDGCQARVQERRRELLPRSLQLHPLGHLSPSARTAPAGETEQTSPGSVFGKYRVLLDRLMFELTVLSQCARSRAFAWACVPAPALLRCPWARRSPPSPAPWAQGLVFLGKMISLLPISTPGSPEPL